MDGSTYISDLIKLLKKYLWLIILLGVIGGVFGKISASKGPAPTYEASALVLIKPQFTQTNTIINQADETNRFLNTAQTLVNTPVVLKTVKKDLNLKENTKELAGKVKTSIENGSEILRITVDDSNSTKATNVVNKTADVFQNEIKKYLDVKSVQVVEKAIKGQESEIMQTRPNANMIMGIVIGLLIGVILSLGLNFFIKPSRVNT
ncbi:YveK family protein [Neobacillus sp. Marseille-QA0830]